MPSRADISDQAHRLRQYFEAQGARNVEAETLLPAATLLDLYGEDIRSRAYVTHDPLMGEMMLRPDFTVPVVQMHMESHADPARYTYVGQVFRKQEDRSQRASEYLQVGYEIFDGSNPAQADAEVFAAISGALGDAPVQPSTGDIGLLIAAVKALNTTDARKAALLRHLWRPGRFRAMLDRFGGGGALSEKRQALIAEDNPLVDAGLEIGLRSRAEIMARIAALREDQDTPPIAAEEIALIDALLSLSDVATHVLAPLQEIALALPAVRPALDRLQARCDALAARGVDIDALMFEGNYGRTSLEYYDGFVFGFSIIDRPDLPPIATGGRYDALTRVLGQGREVPAVGAVVRPDLLLEVTSC
jgi:ATP phosphoribosyltransferase regulatory subunit